jgi:hypothetical protein
MKQQYNYNDLPPAIGNIFRSWTGQNNNNKPEGHKQMKPSKAVKQAVRKAQMKAASKARRSKADKRGEEQRKRDIEGSLEDLISQARTALEYVESRDYEEAECEFQFVSDDADFIQSELESLVQMVNKPLQAKA